MTWWHTHPDAAAIVREHWEEAELLLVAHREPCITIRDAELSNIRRVTRAIDAPGLRAWAEGNKDRTSWMAAVLVCADDDTAELATAVQDLGLDASRFHFYLHDDASVEALRDWADAGLALEAVETGISDWKRLHKLLGIDFNVRIVDDFAGPL